MSWVTYPSGIVVYHPPHSLNMLDFVITTLPPTTATT